MKTCSACRWAICVLVLLLIAAVAAGCGPAVGTSTTANAGPGTTGYHLDEIAAVLAKSDQIADDFRIVDSRIVADYDHSWAGVILSSPGVEDVRVLLKAAQWHWTIVTLGTDLAARELVALGAPQDIADFLGYPTGQSPVSP